MKIYILSFCLMYSIGFAQSGSRLSDQELYEKISDLDSAMFSTIYTCDNPKNPAFFAEDLEFYHDKGGITISKKVFLENLKKNFCSARNFELRRKLVKGSLKVFPLYDGIILYGAVQTGDHQFYEYYPGRNEEVFVGVAKFTHLWLNKDGDWKISRVLSYDHQPAK